MKTEAKIKPFVREKRQSDFSRSIAYAVHGFWSGANVRVEQGMSLMTREWGEPTVTWSCGGRDSKVPDGILAAECFGKAVADAVKIARKWKANPPANPTAR